MEEVIESAAVTLDAMTAAVEAVEAMVTAVDMLDCLAPGKPESDREAAASFFQESLTVPKWNRRPIQIDRLYWPGRLPGLLPLLTDCLRPHNSKTIQSAAVISIKHISNSLHSSGGHMAYGSEGYNITHDNIIKSDTLGKLVDLALETKCPKTRVHIAEIIDTIAHCDIWRPYYINHNFSWLASLKRFFPVLGRMLQEPDNRGNAKKWAIRYLRYWPMVAPNETLLHSGTVQVLVEMLRAGKETKDFIRSAVQVLRSITMRRTNQELNKMMLDAGVLTACHQILKGQYQAKDEYIKCIADKSFRYRASTAWKTTLEILSRFAGEAEEYREAIVSQEGLLELVLEMALELDITEETSEIHSQTSLLVRIMVLQGSGNLVRCLVSKELLLRLLAHHLNTPFDIDHFRIRFIHNYAMETVQTILDWAVSSNGLRLCRRLIDSADVLRRISLTDPEQFPTYANPQPHILARTIIDTYLNNPLPPPPPSKLPFIIYTNKGYHESGKGCGAGFRA